MDIFIICNILVGIALVVITIMTYFKLLSSEEKTNAIIGVFTILVLASLLYFLSHVNFSHGKYHKISSKILGVIYLVCGLMLLIFSFNQPKESPVGTLGEMVGGIMILIGLLYIYYI
jgi:hypothetical protein